MFRHPKYYKELRKRNKTGVTVTTKRNIGHSQELGFGFSPPVTSDQVISSESGTPPNERALDPGLKLPGPRKASSDKQQATSQTKTSLSSGVKQQATSL